MPSGKQILLSLLTTYSQEKTDKNDLNRVSDRLKTGLLLHGSTANYMWKMVEEMAWISRAADESKESLVTQQGLGLASSDILLTELFDVLTDDDNIPAAVKEVYPELTQKHYETGIHMIRLLLKAVEWSINYEGLENELDPQRKEEMIRKCQNKLEHYRMDPEDFS